MITGTDTSQERGGRFWGGGTPEIHISGFNLSESDLQGHSRGEERLFYRWT